MLEKISQNAIIINYTTVAVCLGYIVVNFNYLSKAKLNKTFILTLPSVLIPFFIILGYCLPLIWAVFDKKFRISYLSLDSLDEAVLFIFAATISILLGILAARQGVIQKLKVKSSDRVMDKLLYGENGTYLTIFVILIAIFVFPFAFALRIDLIIGGGIRSLQVNDKALAALIPLARIMLSVFTILSGIILAYRNSKIVLIVPVLEIIQHLMKLSRGFFIPLILFVFSYSLSGKKIPAWCYLLMLFFSFVSGSAAIAARGLGAKGIGGLSSGVNQLNADPLESIRNFFEVNAIVGLISTSVRLRVPSSDVIDGFLAWLKSVLPIPTFLGLTGKHLSIAALLHVRHAGIPMPALGEIYFYMGWGGLLIYLVLGFCLGKIEGELIKHTLIYGKSYWPHVLIWLSMLFGFILSFHSPTRSASRLVVYSIIIIRILRLFVTSKSYS
jgi:hypothetical protein